MRCAKQLILILGCIAGFMPLSGSSAYAAGNHLWPGVARIGVGERLAIYRTQQSYPDACDFLSADENEVICTPPDAPAAERLVFPRAAVREIDTFQTAPDRHIAIWIAAGITVGLVTALCIANPLVGMLMGVTALDVWAYEANSPPLLPQSSGPRIRRHVVYRARIPVTH
jgi:hypothetical protein